jgi:hypothetical protein
MCKVSTDTIISIHAIITIETHPLLREINVAKLVTNLIQPCPLINNQSEVLILGTTRILVLILETWGY